LSGFIKELLIPNFLQKGLIKPQRSENCLTLISVARDSIPSFAFRVKNLEEEGNFEDIFIDSRLLPVPASGPTSTSPTGSRSA
jgi:hypothetical protein